MNNKPNTNYTIQGTHPVQLNLDDLPRKVCHQCGYDVFTQEFRYLEVPELVRYVTQGKDTVTVQFIMCKRCGKAQTLQQMTKATSLSDEKKKAVVIK